MSTNVADELGASIFWGRKTVTVARSSGIWRSTVWQMDVCSDGGFYIQFAMFLATVTNTSQCSLSFIGPLPCAISHAFLLLVPFQLFTTLLNRFTVCRRPHFPCRAHLTNLWHACPKWRAERFPWHGAFTAVPIFVVVARQASVYCEEYVYIYTYPTAYRLCMNYRCYQIKLRVKDFCSFRERCEVLTGYLLVSLGRRSGGDQANTWHWTECVTVCFCNRML
jgi:hypothetical protein